MSGRLYLDPWPGEHDGAWGAEPGVEAVAVTDLEAELPLAEWRELRAAESPEWPELFFVDGSRRMELRLLVEDAGGIRAHGGLGTTAVGAVRLCPGERARFEDGLRVGRWLFTGAGQLHEALLLEPTDGYRGGLRFEHQPVAETDRDSILQALQNRMRLEEEHLTAALVARHPDGLVICDGPLPQFVAGERVIGYVKTTSTERLPPEQLALVARLGAGGRTPIYTVGEGHRRHYEWVLRLREREPWHHSMAGCVRLQVRAPSGRDGLSDFVRRVADWSSAGLPPLASHELQDRRAPQQLIPVMALERELKRRMGDSALVGRRIVREYFARQHPG